MQSQDLNECSLEIEWATRLKDLQNWRTSDGVDFASCVERVMAATDSEQRPGPDVTLLEIDGDYLVNRSSRQTDHLRSSLVICELTISRRLVPRR